MIQRARIELKSCPLSDDSCLAAVIKHIESMSTRNAYGELGFDVLTLLEEKCGRYTRGKHTGKLRGWAKMEVCTVGGWQKFGPGERNGRAVRPGAVLSLSIEDFNGNPYFRI